MIIFKSFNSKNKYLRRLIIIFIDVILITFTFLISIFLSKNNLILINKIDTIIFLILSGVLTYTLSGQYQPITKYIANSSLYKVFGRNLFLTIILYLKLNYIDNYNFNDNFYIIFFINQNAIMIASRIILKDAIVLLNKLDRKKEYENQSIVIYGAGSAGIQLFNTLKYSRNKKVKFFVDDSNKLINRKIDETPIYHPSIIERYKEEIDYVFFAIPSISTKRKFEIMKDMKALGVKVQILPSLDEITTGKSKINLLKPLKIEDLLGRNQVVPNKFLLEGSIKNKSICITGAGGSIGTELCKSIIENGPKKLILIDNSECNLYSINETLKKISLEIEVLSFLANVCDFSSINNIFEKHKIDYIFHAAAYKHVPLVEDNPISGIKNNLMSTINICKISSLYQVKNLILISSDKAVRPTNVMGASKRLCELILLDFHKNIKKSTKFSIVRFGNVLGSSGSVVPLFKKQIEEGGPLTITHPKIIRYFMTTKEAAQLVIQSTFLSKGGEVFLLDMGMPIKILDLAKDMIWLSGLKEKNEDNPNGDIEITFTGLRPGEKLFEEMLIESNSESTEHPLIYKADERATFDFNFSQKLDILQKNISEFNELASIKTLSEIVPEWELSINLKKRLKKLSKD